jgi:cytochrome b subunit of formate dehydrogenase
MVRFYKLRRLIHGPITITIVTVYVVGLLMLTPEFLIHIGPIIYLFNGLFMASGIVIIWFIRKSIRKETLELEEIIAIKRQIES